MCLNCHKQVHLYAFNKLHIPKTKSDEELKTEVEKEIVAENARRKEKDQKELTDEEIDKIKTQKEKLMTDAQQLFSKMYENMQQQAGPQAGPGPDMGGAAGASSQGTNNDNVVDGDYREV